MFFLTKIDRDKIETYQGISRENTRETLRKAETRLDFFGNALKNKEYLQTENTNKNAHFCSSRHGYAVDHPHTSSLQVLGVGGQRLPRAEVGVYEV